MNPQPQIDPNAAGDEVKRLLAEDGTASAALKDLRSAKAARKEALKSALTVVWEAFENKQTVNGFTTRKEWCKGFAKVTPRRCEQIIYGRKRKANHGSPALKAGMTVRVGERKYELTQEMIAAMVAAATVAPNKTPTAKKTTVLHRADSGFYTLCGKRTNSQGTAKGNQSATCAECLKREEQAKEKLERDDRDMRVWTAHKPELCEKQDAPTLVHRDEDYTVLEYPEALFGDVRRLDLNHGVPEHSPLGEKSQPLFYYVACIDETPSEAFTSLGDAKEWIAKEEAGEQEAVTVVLKDECPTEEAL